MTIPDYEEFCASKLTGTAPAGLPKVPRLSSALYPFQADLTRWALMRGRAGLFEDCGLGKTLQELEWGRHVAKYTGGRVLILAPLAVSQQTVREGQKFGIEVNYRRDQSAVTDGLTITNYQMLDHFDPSAFTGIILDESSILKSLDGKTRTAIIEAFSKTPFRLSCTATPAPNDYMELGNQAEFLGVMTRAEMLSMFFVHDGGSTQDWRLKGHAEDSFWRWVCSWAAMVRKPSDLGYEDGAFVLPPFRLHEHVIGVDHKAAHASGMLFKMEAVTLDEQRAARRSTIDARVAKVAELVMSNDRPWLVWCELNDEGDALEAAIPGAVQVAGADSLDDKERRMIDFAEGRIRVLISKPSIAGHGMNWQHCAQMAYLGRSHSYEQFYQSSRRCWRFGQTSPVDCHIIIAETEGRVTSNIKRKEADAARMADAMAVHMRDIQKANIVGTRRTFTDYKPRKTMTIPQWLTTASVEDAK